MYVNNQVKEKVLNVIHHRLANPYEVGTLLIQTFNVEFLEAVKKKMTALNYPEDVSLDYVLENTTVLVTNNASDDAWLQLADTETVYDLSQENEAELFLQDNNEIDKVLMSKVNEMCNIDIVIPSLDNILNKFPNKQYLLKQIEERLNYFKSHMTLTREITSETDPMEIEADIFKSAIQAGFSQSYVSEKMEHFSGYGRPFRYEFRNARINVDAENIAERYLQEANRFTVETYLDTMMIHDLLDDGSITYDIVVIDEPEESNEDD